MNNKFYIPLIAAAVAFSCGRNSESTGMEFAPNMYVSVPLDPMTKVEGSEFPYNPENKSLAVISPVQGTIARGKMPYELHKDSVDLAGRLVKNPIPSSESVLAEGEELYGRFCKHCHGASGDADGPVADPSKLAGVAKLNSGRVATVPEGHVFHVITHGKGRMGAHGSQLDENERWKIVHFVMTLRNQQ